MLSATSTTPQEFEPWLFGTGSWLMMGGPEPTLGSWIAGWPSHAVRLVPTAAKSPGTEWTAWLWLLSAATSGTTHVRLLQEEVGPPLAHSPARMLAEVRAHLSLSMVEVASVLEVERPTVYAWLAGRSEPHERNRRRLQRLFDVALRWSRLSNAPLGNRLRHPDEQGTSVLDLLRSGRFEEAAARLATLALIALPERAVRPPSVAQVLARHGLEDRIRPSRDEIDRLTGKRIAPE